MSNSPTTGTRLASFFNFFYLFLMAYTLCATPLLSSSKAAPKPGNETISIQRHNHHLIQNNYPGRRRLCVVKAKADNKSDERKKPNSVICADCDGNGAVLCSQCKGSGVNSVDFFNGRFKSGNSCWLCGGKKDVLCGNCNGAGFVGGFMSTFDE